MNTNETAARILVEAGYGEYIQRRLNTESIWVCVEDADVDDLCTEVNPFTDTLEGRRQACAIWAWLVKHRTEYWRQAQHVLEPADEPWDGVLQSNKWCLERLAETEQ